MRTPAKTYEGAECARCHKTRRYLASRNCVVCAKVAVYKKRGQLAPAVAFADAHPLTPAAEAQLADLFGDIADDV